MKCLLHSFVFGAGSVSGSGGGIVDASDSEDDGGIVDAGDSEDDGGSGCNRGWR